MEVVSVFNKELKSILESKLPVSRHRMSLITKSAMKALKFYKHVVQSVEKFITKCSCEYKVPGLYVIDAILRQSKHQYCDKDVFVPRFMRNIVRTFTSLSQCDPKDLTSVERVLKLWQQNGVFPTNLVEALLELVYDASDSNKIKAGGIVCKLVNEWNALKGKPEEKMEVFMPPMETAVLSNDTRKSEGGLLDSISKLLTGFQSETGEDVAVEIDQIQILHQKIVEQSTLLAQGEMIDSNTLSHLHKSMEQLTKKAAKAAAIQQSKLATLPNEDKNHINETSVDLEFVEQLQQMVDTLEQTRALQEELKQALESKQQHHHHRHIVNNVMDPMTVNTDFGELEEGEEPYTTENSTDTDSRMMTNNSIPKMYAVQSGSIEYNELSSSSSSGSRKRRRSDSNEEFMERFRSRSRERKRKKKRHSDARKHFMPSLRQNFVSVVSHTVFIGHLHKHLSESKLRSLCEEHGSIAEFNMIPPRGCAFVTFDRRKGAYKTIAQMNDLKFEGRHLKVAWAPNKGVKDSKEFRGLWVEHEGCTYIPTEQFPITRSGQLTDGFAELDEESLTEELKQAIYQFEQQKAEVLVRKLESTPSTESLIPAVVDVGSTNLALISPSESIIDTSTSFFNQFSAPPPMIPSYPPPPPPSTSSSSSSHHLFITNPMIASNNHGYIDYQGSISTAMTGFNTGAQQQHVTCVPLISGMQTCGSAALAPVLGSYSCPVMPSVISSINSSHNVLVSPFCVPPPLINPLPATQLPQASPRARYTAPSNTAFTRPPLPGCPLYGARPRTTRY